MINGVIFVSKSIIIGIGWIIILSVMRYNVVFSGGAAGERDMQHLRKYSMRHQLFLQCLMWFLPLFFCWWDGKCIHDYNAIQFLPFIFLTFSNCYNILSPNLLWYINRIVWLIVMRLLISVMGTLFDMPRESISVEFVPLFIVKITLIAMIVIQSLFIYTE